MVARKSSRKKKTQNVTGATPEDFRVGAKEIEEIDIPEFMDNTYLPYAMSVIQDRALVNADDGLKPSQRRILWTMFVDGVHPTKGYMKVARIAGNVLRYHPHGNTSVEDALCRMVQPYSLRVPLIDGKGAFGAHPGDTPAAARYVEARLDRTAMELLTDIKADTVPMVKNYDGTLDEPTVLPVKWPVSIINGSSGIAVGYAANMPQHNPTEALEASRLVLKNPKATVDDVLKVMPGPDFWTGGTVMGTDGIREYYKTGKGTFIVRAKYDIEYGQRGRSKIIFTELPPGVSCESVVEKVRALTKLGGTFKGVASINNFTGRENENDVRLVVETKAGTNVLALLAALFKKTPLQASFSVNNTVLVDNRPTLVGVVELLQHFINLRKRCVLARTHNAIAADKRQDMLIDALLAVLIDVDKAISIIRHSQSADTAAKKLKTEFKINDEQAQYILNMQLRKLTRQDSIELKEKKKAIDNEIKELQKIIDSPKQLVSVIDKELEDEEKIIGDHRYMEISNMTIDQANQMAKNEMRAVRDQDKDISSYLSTLPTGEILLTRVPMPKLTEKEIGTKDVQPYVSTVKTSTKSCLLIAGSNGTAYELPATFMSFDTPMAMNKLGILPSGVTSAGVVPGTATLFAWTKKGKMRQLTVDFKQGWRERPLMKIDDGDELGGVFDSTRARKDSTVIVVTKKGKAVRWPLSSLSPVSMGSAGIAGLNVDKDDEVAKVIIARPKAENLITLSKRTIKTTPLEDIPLRKNRGGSAVITHVLMGADRIRDAVVDGAVLNKNKIIAAPRPTGRGNKIAPAMAAITLSPQ